MSSESRPQRLLGRLVSPVVDAVDPDALLERVDLNELVDRVDLDAALNRVDIDRLIDRVDLDAVLQKVDLNGVLQKVDLNAVVQRVDLNAVVQKIDLNAVLEQVDVDALIQRIDIEGVVKRVRVGSVVADTASDISSRSIESARRTVARVDAAVLRPIDRAAGRQDDPDRAQVKRLAGPVARLSAWIVDTIVITLSFSAAIAVGGYLVELMSDRTVDPTAANKFDWLGTGLVWGAVYLFLSWFLAQRTVGMRLLGIRLTRTNGSEVRARDAAIRLPVFAFSLATFWLPFIGVVIGRRRRGLPDVAAGTLVVSDTAAAVSPE